MTRRALITGLTGQDGSYLAEFLLAKGYEVYGLVRRTSVRRFENISHMLDRVTIIDSDLSDFGSLAQGLRESEPDEIYHLAAQSFVGASFSQPTYTGDVTGLGVTRILEAARMFSAQARIYNASTSELYGGITEGNSLNEGSPFQPRSPYAAAKLYAFWLSRIYREGYGMFVANGILFNHESPRRGTEFVTRKISLGVARIKEGLQKKLVLGNVEARRDWGYAPEYVESMWSMLQHNRADDFVVATGETHSVREFLEIAFDVVGIDDYQRYLQIDRKLFRPTDVPSLCGDATKARQKLGWKAKTKFRELVKIMVEADLRRLGTG
jgi:GDPmannose 4,6-dehydratase